MQETPSDNNPVQFIKKGYHLLRHYFPPSGTRHLIVLSVMVGLTAGFIAYLLGRGIHVMEDLFYNGFQDMAARPLSERIIILVLPAIGGALVGWVFYFCRVNNEFHGVVDVVHALIRQNSRLPLISSLLKGFSTILTMGFGGSVGPEAPIVHMGSAIGSTYGQWGKTSPEVLKVLLAAGAAGGVGAAFSAPLAGVMFSLEVILLDFTAHAFSMVVIWSVTAAVVARTMLGESAFFYAPVYGLNSAWELILYIGLGLAAGFVGKLFMFMMSRMENSFSKFKKISVHWRPALGGLFVGVIGFYLPQTLGSGHGWVQSAIEGQIPLLMCLLLLVGKMVATSITLGSSGSGGVFLPVLFVGAMLGQGVGILAHTWFPQTIQPGAYALGGMAALFSAAFHSPITGILILFELTRDYQLILPFMLASVIATLLSRVIHPENMNTLRLSNMGIHRTPAKEINILDGLVAQDVMTQGVETLSPELTLAKLTTFVQRSKHTGFPVVNGDRRVVGIVTYNEIHDCFNSGELPEEVLIVKDIMRESFPIIKSTDPLAEVLRLMYSHKIDRIPVVESSDTRKLLGLVTQSDILTSYKKVIQLDGNKDNSDLLL